MNRQQNQIPVQLPAGPDSEIIRADGLARLQYTTIEAGVIIPALQGVVTGVLVGPGAGFAAGALGAANPWFVAGVVGFGASAVVYLAMLQRWHNITWSLDMWRPDSSGPQVLTNQVDRIQIDVRQDNRSTQILHLGLSAEKLASVARLVLGGRSFSEREFLGLLSQSEFRALRDELIKRGMLAWRNGESPQQGADFTVFGRQVMRRLAALPSPTDE